MDTPKFPHHRDCEALTGITLDHLPRDGSLGRVRRFAKGAFLWQPTTLPIGSISFEEAAWSVMTAKPHERPVALRTIEPNQPFGEVVPLQRSSRYSGNHGLCAGRRVKRSKSS